MTRRAVRINVLTQNESGLIKFLCWLWTLLDGLSDLSKVAAATPQASVSAYGPSVRDISSRMWLIHLLPTYHRNYQRSLTALFGCCQVRLGRRYLSAPSPRDLSPLDDISLWRLAVFSQFKYTLTIGERCGRSFANYQKVLERSFRCSMIRVTSELTLRTRGLA